MNKFTSVFILAFGLMMSVNASKNVTNISECPPLTPRTTPISVHDLRPDDIKVVGALGDSITAGFGIMGINESLPSIIDSYKEYRGLSYSIGGEDGAFTIPNYIKHYQSNVTGYSMGIHDGEVCSAENCNSSYYPAQDVLNAAQSGAIAMNLEHEVDYLLRRIHDIEGLDFQNDWKMINIQIGSNDMCSSCNESYIDHVTPDKFGNYVETAIEKIQANIPRVLVNLISTFNVSRLFPLSENQPYCNGPNTYNNTQACACATVQGGLEKMDALSAAYNEKLFKIYEKYQQERSDNFTVIYQQGNLNITSFPIDFFSNLDCFHPGLKGHQWVSKVVWNQLFSPQTLKPKVFNFDENETIYCPIDSDRITTR